MLPLVTLLLATYISTIHCTVYCRDYDECKDYHYVNDADQAIRCDGAKSCHDFYKLYGTSIYCRGYQSCEDTQYILAYGDLKCSGDSSCKNVYSAKVYGSTGELSCNGASACYGATILESPISITCSGYQSCIGVDYFKTSTLYCVGYLSCRSATISSAYTLDHVLYATGDEATGGSDYICDEDSTSCTIICEGTGCKDLTIVYPNTKADITITPASCKASKNQGQDIAAESIVMWCPTFISAADYAASGGSIKIKKAEEEDAVDMELFVEAESEAFLSSHGSMNVKELLFYGSMVANGILFASCVYQRYKRKEYLPL